MQKFTKFALSLVMAFVAMVANAETKLYFWDNLTGANSVTFADGATLAITGNSGKSYSSANNITVDGEEYASIKLSNGAQNTFTCPTGKIAQSVKFYSYVNLADDKLDYTKYPELGYRQSYWSEVGGQNYAAEGRELTSRMNGATPDAVSFRINDAASFTFTNKGEQLCFVMEVTYSDVVAGNPWDITGVAMNWMGESYATGSEVEALSYMYNVETGKEGVVAGEGHIEFKDAAGNGIGVGSWNGYYLSFMNFGQEGYKTPGTYTLVIPAGALVDAEGNPCNEFTATWTVVAPETSEIHIEGSEVGKVVEGKNTYYTTTVKFQKPENAKYAYSEGLFVELNGEKSATPFVLGQYGTVELDDDNDEVTLVFTDKIPAATTDFEYEGDLRSVGTYVATTTITFMDEDYKEIMSGSDQLKALYTGTLVLTDVSVVSEASWVGIEDDVLAEDMINVGITLQLPNLNIAENDQFAVMGWLVDNSKEVEDDMDTNQYDFTAKGGFDVETGVPSVTILAENPALIKGHTYTVTVMGIHAGADEDSFEPVWVAQTGTELSKTFFIQPNPCVSYAALTVEGQEDIAIDLAPQTVEVANGIAVRFDGFMPQNATYAIDAIDRETGDVIYSVASGTFNRGFASFEKETKFISGYQYTATIKAWEGEMMDENFNVLEPTVSEVYTFHGANAVGIVGEPQFGVERGQLTDDMINLGVKVSIPEVLLPGLVDINNVKGYVSATLYGVPTGNEPMPISGEEELGDDNMGVDGPVELSKVMVELTDEGGVWSAYLFAEDANLEVGNHYAVQLDAVTFVEGEETIVAELDDPTAYSVEFDVVPAAGEVILGDAVINVDGMELTATDVEANGIVLAFPFAENVTEETEIKVVADLAVAVPGYGMGGDEVDGSFGAPNFQVALENVEFVGSINIETGVVEVPMTDFALYVVEAGAGQYMINVKSILVNGLDVYSSEDELADPIGAMFAVVDVFEVEATAKVAETEANQYGDQHYQVIVTVENSDNEVSAAGVAYAYTEGVIFYDESTWSEFTFNCEAQEGVEVVEEQDIVLTCTDAMVSQTTDAAFEGEIRAEGTYPAHCIVVLVDANYNEVGTARFNGNLTLTKTATGINVAKFNVTDVKYNLSGQRVNNANGIVIMNGKKYMTK